MPRGGWPNEARNSTPGCPAARAPSPVPADLGPGAGLGPDALAGPLSRRARDLPARRLPVPVDPGAPRPAAGRLQGLPDRGPRLPDARDGGAGGAAGPLPAPVPLEEARLRRGLDRRAGGG